MNGGTHNNESSAGRDEGPSSAEFVVDDVRDGDERLRSVFDAPGRGASEIGTRELFGADPKSRLGDAIAALFRVDVEDVASTASSSVDGAPICGAEGEPSTSWGGEGQERKGGRALGSDAPDASALAEAADSFAVELSSMLDDAEDFALDIDAELEIDGSDPDLMSGISETFLLDDSEGISDLGEAPDPDAAEAAVRDSAPGARSASAFDSTSLTGHDLPRVVCETPDGAAGRSGSCDAAASVDAAWEPSADGAVFEAFAEEASAADEAGGSARARRRVARLALGAAAAVSVCAGLAVFIWSALLGNGAAPTAVEQIDLVRPRVAVPVSEPPRPAAGGASGVAAPAPRPGTPEVQASDSRLARDASDDASADGQGALAGAAAAANADAVIDAQRRRDLGSAEQRLARFGESLLVGGLGAARDSGGPALAGVRPGQRAFAQLRNGNHFIGRVKRMSRDEVTFEVDTGEVTLLRRDLAQLTRLGAAERQAVQAAAQGSVRLTNDNRLVGGILRRVEDDVIVLEGRQNRVMLPASAVVEIVGGDERGGVRLGSTGVEEPLLGERAERESTSVEGQRRPSAPPPKRVDGERR